MNGRGRWLNIEYNLRLCSLCNVLEDEFHIINVYPRYAHSHFYETQFAEWPFSGCHSGRQAAKDAQWNTDIDENFFKVEMGQLVQQSERVHFLWSNIWAVDTLQLQHFLGQLFRWNICRVYFSKICWCGNNSLISGYSRKNWNVLLIWLAALILVLSPAMTESIMSRKTFLRNSFSGVKLSVERFVCLPWVCSGVIQQAPATCWASVKILSKSPFYQLIDLQQWRCLDVRRA